MVKQTTIQEVLDGHIDAPDHRLYVVRDGATVFYVGQSARPIERIQAHLGLGFFGLAGPSTLGRWIEANLPDSLT